MLVPLMPLAKRAAPPTVAGPVPTREMAVPLRPVLRGTDGIGGTGVWCSTVAPPAPPVALFAAGLMPGVTPTDLVIGARLSGTPIALRAGAAIAKAGACRIRGFGNTNGLGNKSLIGR